MSDEITCKECTSSIESICHINLDAIVNLKKSTKQLLSLLEELQTKIHSRNPYNVPNESALYTNAIKFDPESIVESNVTDVIGSAALRKLENNAKELEAIYIEDEDDDCSIYKRLTRKCHCLNHPSYNDFIIHFNEVSKYTTSNLGEIIKNLRILKKFLYMGGDYTKNALVFLNEGLRECKHTEKVDITQGCTHADICNIFDEHSIIITCISWPCKYRSSGDHMTQNLGASVVYKLAEIEEGRRYLNYSSKICNDIRKVLRKKSSLLEVDTVDTLNAILNLLKPTFAKNMALTYFTKSIYEGIGRRTISDLVQYRQHMILDEVLMHLDLLKDYSCYDTGKQELKQNLPAIFMLFKHLLIEYDESRLNIVITNILNNIVSKNLLKQDNEMRKAIVLMDTSTEPVQMKNEICQMPPKKTNMKKGTKANTSLGVSPNKHKQASKKKVPEMLSSIPLNRSRKFTQGLQNVNSMLITIILEYIEWFLPNFRYQELNNYSALRKINHNVTKNAYISDKH